MIYTASTNFREGRITKECAWYWPKYIYLYLYCTRHIVMRLYTPVSYTHLCTSCFKTSKPVVALRSAHTNIPICLLKHFKHFCKSFTKFEANFYAKTLFFKLFHFHYGKNFAESLQHVPSNFSCCRRITAMVERSGILDDVSENCR